MDKKLKRLTLLLTLACMVCTGVSVASPSIAAVGVSVVLTPNHGPAGCAFTATGSGWPASTTVQIYFDTSVNIGSAIADTGGNFTKTGLLVPASATLGTHPVFF